ncbi:MAG: flagellar motor protein MotB [Pseudomonadales bacterium]
MSDEVEDCPECPAGIPAWMATFADLMSLLMCFFVLLLSFSEMDLLKYKQLAGSMSAAFGVQNQINVKDIPKGTSIIAQEFSPGKPDPTPINEIRQSTTDVTKNTLDIKIDDTGTSESGLGIDRRQEIPDAVLTDEATKDLIVAKLKKLINETEDDARALAKALKKEISTGKVDVETRGRRIIIRVREQGSFLSGSAELRRQFVPVMASVRGVLKNVNGNISVEGHTDSVPIATHVFRSNWDLSSARALSVAHELFKGGVLDTNRFMVTGFAAAKPLVKNDTVANRARNRRVEIVVQQALDKGDNEDVKRLQQLDPNYFKEINLDPNFVLSPDEIF